MTTATSPQRAHLILGFTIISAGILTLVLAVLRLLDPPSHVQWDVLAASVTIPLGALAVFRGLRGGVLVTLGWVAGVQLANPAAAENILYGGAIATVLIAVDLAVRAWRSWSRIGDDVAANVIAEVADAAADLEHDVTGRKVIGLSGYARAGKDAASKALLWEGWAHASFAAPLKNLTELVDAWVPVHRGMPGYEAFNVADEEKVWVRYGEYVAEVGPELAKENPEVRRLQQQIGTRARQVLGDDVWVDAAFANLPADKDVVFTDVRFPNEAEAIRAAGGHVIRIEREGVGPVNGHVSETALDGYDFDAWILNDSDLRTLGGKLKNTIARLDVMAHA